MHGIHNKLDNIEIQMLRTELDGIISEEAHNVTKIRDTTLFHCANKKQPNMLEMGVMGTCIFVWAERERMACRDAKHGELSQKGWDNYVKKRLSPLST